MPEEDKCKPKLDYCCWLNVAEYFIHGLVKGISSGTSLRYFWYSGSLPHLSIPDFSSKGTPKIVQCHVACI